LRYVRRAFFVAVMARRRTVLISGAGIAGSTLAYWLLQNGFEPTIVERAPAPRTGGYIIDFWGLGYDVADRMGLVPDLKREGYDVNDVRFVDTNGERVGGFGVDVVRSITDGRFVSLQRATLASLLYEKIDGRCDFLFDDSIAAINPDAEGASVAFERSASRRFHFVVGADGVHSRVRQLTFGDQRNYEKYLGYMVAAADVQGYRPRTEGAYVCYSIPGKQIARFAMRGDRTVFLFVMAAGRPFSFGAPDRLGQKEFLRAEFTGAGWECDPILDAVDRSNDIYFDRVSQIRMDCWSKGPVALIGDAAFAPSLLAGEGAALAMAAAYVLAGEVSSSPLPDAFRRYEQRLRPTLLRKHQAAARFARSFVPMSEFGLMVRNLVTRSFGWEPVAKWAFGGLLKEGIELPSYRGVHDVPQPLDRQHTP
jgi:2-polyprenyl-6-methoxyphenol hydroxylase-like FAD-dependent oxidoreductase